VWIVVGFSLTLIAAMIVLGNDIDNGFFGHLPASDIGQAVVYPLSFIPALIGWWFLSSLFVGNVEQIRLARRAFLFLAAQYLLLAVVSAIELSGYPLRDFGNFASLDLSACINLAGMLTTFVGFVVLQSSFWPNSKRHFYLEAFEASLDEEGDDIPLDAVLSELES
jgi:hypothetical protein